MTKNKLLRKLKFSMSLVRLPYDVLMNFTKFSEYKEDWLESSSDTISKGPSIYGHLMVNRATRFMNIFTISKELGISDDDLQSLWLSITKERRKEEMVYMLKPQKEGRDNKGVYVGGGGSNANKVRYPSKKRSKKTWKTFYGMFPYYAKRDGWDGQKSSRYQ